MPAARLILVVHAATPATRKGTFPRSCDQPEAADLAAASRLALPAAAATLTAPSLAAELTAQALGLAVHGEAALRDLDAGLWAGTSPATITPADLAAWTSDPNFDGHGGESLSTMALRVGAFLDDRLKSKGTTIAVTHGAIARAAVLATLRAPPSAFWCVEAPPLAVVTLSSDGRRWTLRSLDTRPIKPSDE